jgi:hypothetical protein
MHTLHLVLYIAAALCFLAATFTSKISPNFSLLALGLLLWVLNPLITTADQ